jgi:DtxR family Mn-dependent transcriptional regulator
VTLTPSGRLEALRVLRKHRLIETFLVEVLKLPVDEVNEEACRLEHAVSDRVTDAMDAALGFPATDPHGHPIPDREGSVDEVAYQSLADALPGWTVLVKQVNDRDRDRLHYLKGLGVLPGVRLTVRAIAPFGGPINLDISGKDVVVAQSMARVIGIKRVETKQTDIKREGSG